MMPATMPYLSCSRLGLSGEQLSAGGGRSFLTGPEGCRFLLPLHFTGGNFALTLLLFDSGDCLPD